MKAVVHHRYGFPEVLALEEIDTLVVGDDDVLIRVYAGGALHVVEHAGTARREWVP